MKGDNIKNIMIDVKQKSGILKWSEENINNVPPEPGVYVLRSTPISGSIIDIEESDNLHDSLLKIYKEEMLSEVNFFDWYSTNNKEEAKIIKETLVT